AEDGIRDRTVTGVQTCALPISVGRAHLPAVAGVLQGALLNSGQVCAAYSRVYVQRRVADAFAEAAARAASSMTVGPGLDAATQRSEERRVGKEWRSVGSGCE